MSKQTAVELFALDLYEKGLLKGNGDEIQELLEQAKQMEKEQIEIAFAKSYLIGCEEVSYNDANKASENYYNETYGGSNEQ
jgi:hypothetical protein